MKTQNASTKRYERIRKVETLKQQVKSEWYDEECWSEEDITNAVINMREKLKEYGNDYLIAYYDSIFGRWD